MAISKKVAAIGAAGIVALGGAGLYAGSLTVTAPGALGAGSAQIQASCATSATIVPSNPVWLDTATAAPNPAGYYFDELTVNLTALATACDNQFVTANVYDDTDGTELSTNAAAVEIDDVNANPVVTVPLDDPVAADIDPNDYRYGLLVTPTA